MDNNGTNVTTPAAPASAPAKSGSSYAIPGAILVGFAMIAAAIYFSGGLGGNSNVAGTPTTGTDDTPIAADSIPAVSEADHILGNPNAPIVLVEYSDFDCPFCKKYHEETIQPLMDEYGSTGKVALVYRHFPLQQLHPNAPKLAEASECVAALGGNDAFWKFSDMIFNGREINAQTDMTKLTSYATSVGVDATEFNTCLDEGRYADKVAADQAGGLNAGVQGTPHTFVLVGDQQGSISGAQPYAMVKQLIDNLISQMEDGTAQ